MCLNATKTTYKNLNNANRYSPLHYTKFSSSNIPTGYQTKLTAAG